MDQETQTCPPLTRKVEEEFSLKQEPETPEESEAEESSEEDSDPGSSRNRLWVQRGDGSGEQLHLSGIFVTL